MVLDIWRNQERVH